MKLGIRLSTIVSFLILVLTLSDNIVSKQFGRNHSYDKYLVCNVEESEWRN
jgi:hypothetical protein